MKCDSFEHDYPKVINKVFNKLAADLKTLFKPLPIIFAESSDTFH